MDRDYLDNVRECAICGKVMTGVGTNRKYCSRECELVRKREAYKIQQQENKSGTAERKSKKPDTKNCKDCHWYRNIATGIKGCHYLLITGEKRPCPPGKGCTVKVKVKRKEKTNG